MNIELIPLFFVIAIVLATIGLGIWATRFSKTASDFFVASRQVSVGWNASAISGEYLSAASFMGVAGLIMKNGYDALWYPVCYAAGYMFLLLFIAGPLRRFGAYTIPDFAEGRFDSPMFRKIAVTFVLFIGFFYTMPQMKGAGITLGSILHWPYWAGIAVVGSVITFNVAIGGMKGITFVQAFQYWVKMFAIALPIFVIFAVSGHVFTDDLRDAARNPNAIPMIEPPQAFAIPGAEKAPANTLSVSTDFNCYIPAGASIKANKSATLYSTIHGWFLTVFEKHSYPFDSYERHWLAGETIDVPTTAILFVRPQLDGPSPYAEKFETPAKIEFLKPATLTLDEYPGDTDAANSPTNGSWLKPFGQMSGKWGFPLLYTYSLIVALVCGTAGLPHILVRFYTNPDGRAAKRTTFWVMVLIGSFYLFTPMWGTLGRSTLPALYVTGKTDLAVIKVPQVLKSKLLGQILSGITSAGAFAAFMSTFSGLLVSMSGAFAHDIYGKMIAPHASPRARLNAFKIAAILFGIVAMVLGYMVETFDIAMMVGWAFAIGACSYFPLLLLGSWWRGLTKYGAGIGMLTGGLLALAAIVTHMLLDKKILTFTLPPIVRTLMEQPAIWGVPLALITMFIVSKLTAHHVPRDVDFKMLRLHAPEELGVSKNYIEH